MKTINKLDESQYNMDIIREFSKQLATDLWQTQANYLLLNKNIDDHNLTQIILNGGLGFLHTTYDSCLDSQKLLESKKQFISESRRHFEIMIKTLEDKWIK